MTVGAVRSQAYRDFAIFSSECYLIYLQIQIDDELQSGVIVLEVNIHTLSLVIPMPYVS
jgi:hypothetical protein